jgi:predicted GNAT family acetyltransferase
MQVRFHDDISEFSNLATPFLLEHEAENNLLLGILDTVRVDPYRYGDSKPVLISVIDGNQIILISLRTPPFNHILSYTNDLRSIEALVEALNNRNIELPGVMGNKKSTEQFVNLWCKRKGLKANLSMNERIYKLESVKKETLGNKELIQADKSFTELIFKWGRAFIVEAFSENELKIRDNWKNSLQRSVDEGRIYLLLDNGLPVSMVRKAGKTPNGITLNLVYTPPSLRRKGYATECVAKLSKLLLDEGNKFCFLFTDLTNLTSNSIYQKIGYRPIIDIDQYEFEQKD